MRKRALIALVVGIACTEFPNEPQKSATVSLGTGWTREWFVRDSDILSIVVTLPDSTSIVGLNVDWQSSDPSVLDVRRLPAQESDGHDSLTVQIQATAIARARGHAQVRVTIEGAAFARRLDTTTLVVHERWLAISAGKSHTCAIASDSAAYCWGAAENGSLGNGVPVPSATPVPVLRIGESRFIHITAGDENSCGIIAQEVVYCWGWGSLGRLGTGSQTNQFVPTLVSLGQAFVAVTAGQTSCGVSSQAVAFCWGTNSDLQLGTPLPQSGLDVCGAVTCSLKPLAVWVPGDTFGFKAVDVAIFHTCGISNDQATLQEALCWGSGLNPSPPEDSVYLLGDTGSAAFKHKDPIRVAIPVGSALRLHFKSLGLGDRHACGVLITGSIYCWGHNDRGQLGLNSRTNHAKPISVVATPSFDSIVAGLAYTCGLASGGSVYCWGGDDYGQLGIDSVSTGDRLVPTLVVGGHQFDAITAGDFHTCGITTNGAAYCWGRNSIGQLGTSDATTTCTVGGRGTSCGLRPSRVSDPPD